MSPLELLLREKVAAGPIPVADYMHMALAHPEYGYYRVRDPLGTQGDFVTAPEVSQMFGELIGLWCAHVWGLMGAPEPLHLVELGPGRGTLMADALRACAKVAASFLASLDVHLVETSPALREKQAALLSDYDVTWHEDLSTLPDGPSLIIANEFFDALPIHQLVRAQRGWCERKVALTMEGKLKFVVDRTTSPLANLLAEDLESAPVGSIAEVSLAAREVAAVLGDRIAKHGGAALIIDYGYSKPAAGDTLQALRHHAPHPVLELPGEADLTAHVDFSAIAATGEAAGVTGHGPIDQGVFLRRLGIVERAHKLARAGDRDQAVAVDQALDRLVGTAKMGTLFKVLALGPRGLEPLPGFVP